MLLQKAFLLAGNIAILDMVVQDGFALGGGQLRHVYTDPRVIDEIRLVLL